MIPVYRNIPESLANEYAMVLASAHIPHHMIGSQAGWTLLVDAEQAQAADDLINQYIKENALPDSEAAAFPRARFRTGSGIWVALLLLVVHVAVSFEGNQENIFEVFGASADHILDGEIYRCVTALLLHADIRHLLGNLAGVIVLGTAVCVSAGWGLGWGMILFSGIAGNALNEVFYQTHHLSVGASTAVFGAVGILCAFTFSTHMGQRKKRLRFFLPLGAGLALLGFLGAGQHADLMAHLFGLLCGLAIGGGYRFIERHVVSPWIQTMAAALAAAILAGAWLSGLWPDAL